MDLFPSEQARKPPNEGMDDRVDGGGLGDGGRWIALSDGDGGMMVSETSAMDDAPVDLIVVCVDITSTADDGAGCDDMEWMYYGLTRIFFETRRVELMLEVEVVPIAIDDDGDLIVHHSSHATTTHNADHHRGRTFPSVMPIIDGEDNRK
jgi:hypothetical protein